MTADEFRCRVHHDIGAPLYRAAQIGRRERVIHKQGQSVLVCDSGDDLDVQDVAAGIADCLAEESLRIVAHGRAPRVRLVRVDPRHLDAHLAQQMLELIYRAAIQRR
jgi:hypothetical protein